MSSEDALLRSASRQDQQGRQETYPRSSNISIIPTATFVQKSNVHKQARRREQSAMDVRNLFRKAVLLVIAQGHMVFHLVKRHTLSKGISCNFSSCEKIVYGLRLSYTFNDLEI